MQLYEFQAKQVFKEHGISVPKGRLATSADQAAQIASELGRAVAIKAQVAVGGRGLAGAVKFATDPNEAEEIATTILGMDVRGEIPTCVLVEEKMEIVRELYAGMTWDYANKCPVIVASSRGGVDIESVARNHPRDIGRLTFDPFRGYSAYHGRELATRIGLRDSEVGLYSSVLSSLWAVFNEHDAELVEANPLAVLRDGTFVALDAKFNLDDKSVYRQSNFIDRLEKIPPPPPAGLAYRRFRAKERGIPTYIEMEGNIGVVADGAGSGMLTLDLVADAGGKTRAYCEMGGEATAQLIESAVQVVLANEDVRVVLINLIGGLNLMDEMAKGIANYVVAHSPKLPIVVRMSGTREDEGRRILSEHKIEFFDNLYDAVETAVRFSKGS
jgi:succinyl-CoA synthetase beta subunit